MVGASIGAVAHRRSTTATKSSTTTTSTMQKASKPVQPPSKADNKELLLLQSKMMKNESIGELNVNEIDKLMKQNKEEKPENSDDSQKDKEKTSKRRPRIAGVAYDFDPDDHDLTYASKVIDKKPFFYEEYDSQQLCFDGLPCFTVTGNVTDLSNKLMNYINDVLATWEPQQLGPKTEEFRKCCRETTNFTNVCINPLQAMRAWGLLANLAQNKTRADVMSFVSKYTTGEQYENVRDLNQDLLNLHVSLEEDFDGCVRLFTESPHHMSHNHESRRVIDKFYGGKSRRAAIQHHSFSIDPDGFYSTYRVNEECALSTNSRIRYIVPEPAAPNWRAQMVITSAMDCTFHWKTLEKASETYEMMFMDPNCKEPQVCSGIYAKADVLITQDKRMIRLDSWLDGFKLYLIKDDLAPNEPRRIKKQYYERIQETIYWSKFTGNVFIPKGTTSTPISLQKHSKLHGLARVYCSEKSQLSELKERRINEKVNFTTLFDHYHKINFEITAHEPKDQEEKEVFDVLGPGTAHQSVDVDVFHKYQRAGKNYHSSLFTYHEPHLNQNPYSVAKPNQDAMVVDTGVTDLVFNEPFFFLMTRIVGTTPMVMYGGYFNNTVWVNHGSEEN